MTFEEAILSRSYLPKDGTYTMEDHILAMQMDIVGSCAEVKLGVEREQVVVKEVKASLKVKEDIIKIKVDQATDNVDIQDSSISIEVKCG
jgi:hypothetical protein